MIVDSTCANPPPGSIERWTEEGKYGRPGSRKAKRRTPGTGRRTDPDPGSATRQCVILLLSTYDLGRQPFGLASPAAWLRRAGHRGRGPWTCRDRRFDPALARRARRLVAVYLPMHTATRLALPVHRSRCGPLNPDGGALRLRAVRAAERRPAARARRHPRARARSSRPTCWRSRRRRLRSPRAAPSLERHRLRAPASHDVPRLAFDSAGSRGLPALDRYASLQMPDGTRRVVGATDATRGCKHRCRHCPIVPVYDGQFRVVPVDVVLADVRAQVEQGAAAHHALAIPTSSTARRTRAASSRRFTREWPALTYDVTIKVEHLLAHRDLLPRAARHRLPVRDERGRVGRRCACWRSCEKGHTRADFIAVAARCAARPA